MNNLIDLTINEEQLKKTVESAKRKKCYYTNFRSDEGP